MKIPKIKNVVANIFRTLFEKMSLTKILRPNLWAKHDPMVILSLSTFREKVRFDCIFRIEIPLVHGKQLFHFKQSGMYFQWFLKCFLIVFSSCFDGSLNHFGHVLWGYPIKFYVPKRPAGYPLMKYTSPECM